MIAQTNHPVDYTMKPTLKTMIETHFENGVQFLQNSPTLSNLVRFNIH